MDDPTAWWVISGIELLDALRRVAAGENAETVYRELLAAGNVIGPDDE